MQTRINSFPTDMELEGDESEQAKNSEIQQAIRIEIRSCMAVVSNEIEARIRLEYDKLTAEIVKVTQVDCSPNERNN